MVKYRDYDFAVLIAPGVVRDFGPFFNIGPGPLGSEKFPNFWCAGGRLILSGHQFRNVPFA